MKKTELMRAFYKIDSTDSHVWSCWVDWRRKQAGVSIREEGWNKIMKEVPEFYDWTPYHQKGHVTFTWDGGEENVPLEEFVDDLDDQQNLVMLWHENYYDGPLSGMADFNGTMVWFDLEDENEDRYRTYNLYRLTDEERDVFCRHHKEFQEKVGTHCDYGEEYKPFSFDNEDRPAWCPLWIYRLWRRHQFNSFYRTSDKRKRVDLKDRQPFLVVDECNFERERENHV